MKDHSSRWLPVFDPDSFQEIEDFAEQARRPLIGRSLITLWLAGSVCLVALILISGPIFLWWATSTVLLISALFCFDYCSQQRSTKRVLAKIISAYGDRPRLDAPSSFKDAKIEVTCLEDRFGRNVVGIGVWRTVKGRWQQVGWAARPQRFKRSSAADACAAELSD